MKKQVLLMVIFGLFIQPAITQSQNHASCDCFYPWDFSANSYTPIYPNGYTNCEGLIDSALTDISLVSASVSLTGDASSAFVLQEGRCVLYRNIQGPSRPLLFRYDEPFFVITERDQGEMMGSIVDTDDFSSISYATTGLHKFQYDHEDESFWSFQSINGYNQVTSKQFIDQPGFIVEHQQTSGLGSGSYLDEFYWVDFGMESSDTIHSNSFHYCDGWLSHSARHLNEVSIEKIGVPGTKKRLRSWYDPLNDYTWIGGDSVIGGIHDSKIVGEPTDSVVQVSFWDNGNFRSWDQTFNTVYVDVNNDNIIDTVNIANLPNPSYSRGLLVELNNNNLTATILQEFLPNGLFFGGAMGGFQILDSVYTFCYGMVDGYEYPILPFPEPQVNEDFPLFGLVEINSGEKLFSGYYSQPGLVMYQLQAVSGSIVNQPEIQCESLQNETYRLTAPQNIGAIQWSSGESGLEIIVSEGDDYLFWQTDEEYNLVSKPLKVSAGNCLITGMGNVLEDRLSIPWKINRSELIQHTKTNQLKVYDLLGKETRPQEVSTGVYILRNANYGSSHLIVD